jgi:sec-independent protein translocase protein TatC
MTQISLSRLGLSPTNILSLARRAGADMAFADDRPPDPDDMFADTRMSFGDHIEELRTCLWRAIVGFVIIVVGVFVCDLIGLMLGTGFGVGVPAMHYIVRPVEEGLKDFYEKRVEKVRKKLREDALAIVENKPTPFTPITVLKEEAAKDPRKPVMEEDMKTLVQELGEAEANQKYRVITDKDLTRTWMSIDQPVDYAAGTSAADRVVGRRPTLSTLSVMEGMVVYFKVATVCGLLLASPWIFIQVWMFIAAGLYPHEKRYVNVYLPFSLGLFLLGAAVCEFFVMPKAVGALLWFNQWLDLEPELRLNEWLSFAIWMPLIFGLAFQTPLVMLFLERIGVMTIETYKKSRRIAWFMMAVFAAFIVPSPDPMSVLLMWLPMCLLYELGIFLCWWSGPRKPFDLDVPEPEEMVEV